MIATITPLESQPLAAGIVNGKYQIAPPTEQENRFVIDGVSWLDYERIGESFRDRYVRMTYDRQRLEITTLSFHHESFGAILGMLVDILCDELEIPMLSCGSMTLKRQDLERGIEPDRCYYLGDLSRVLRKSEIDLNVDPPPNLAIEVEIASSVSDRLDIHSAIGIEEVWRVSEEGIAFLQLSTHGTFVESDQSKYFPQITRESLFAFARRGRTIDQSSIRREFRRCLRNRIATNWSPESPSLSEGSQP